MAIDTSNLPPIPDGFQIKEDSTPSSSGTSSSTGKLPPIPDGFQLKGASGTEQQRKPFYSAIGAEMTPEMKAAHPILSGIEQTAQDVGTVAEKAANGLTLGGLDYGLRKGGIEPPNFDNTAPENKSGLNLMGDAANLGAGNKAIGTIGSKVVAPVAKGIAKAVPEGLKQSSYALMQSIVNQLPKEFKYGANAGRAMVKEKFSGDAAAIKEQADKRIEEIGGQGDSLAASSNKPVDNSNAMKVIDDKISELQAKSPRGSSSTIIKLQNAKKDLLGVVEDDKGNVIDEGKDFSKMTPKETLDFKRDFDEQTQWKGTSSDDSVFNRTMQQARGKLKDNLNDAAPGMKDWNQRYADLRAAQQAAGRRVTYDQAGAGLRNIISNAVRGSIGITTLGAALHGNAELAGEIIAGWGAKEVLGNPMVKSKLAQALYGLSETDKLAIFKAVPWLRKGIGDAMENFRQKPNPRGEPVDAELIDNRPKGLPSPNPILRNDRLLPSDAARGSGPIINQPGYIPPGLPNNAVSRRGLNPQTSMGALPDHGNIPIRQSGTVPKGLPEPFQGRSGIDRPWENNALPSPRKAGQSSGPIIKQGTSYEPPSGPKKYPKTDFGHQIKYQMGKAEQVPLHPAKDARGELSKIYDPVTKPNPNINSNDIEDFNVMRDWESEQQKGGWIVSGGKQTGEERVVTKTPSSHSKIIQQIGPKKSFEIMDKAANGENMTLGDKVSLKRMLEDFRKNTKPKMEGLF